MRVILINIAWWLIHVYLLPNIAVEECILNINLAVCPPHGHDDKIE
jgi:hypothetical protein